MPSLVDSMRQKADQAALEADKLIRIRREQGAIDQLRRDIKAQLDALGQAALAGYRAGEITHPQLGNICQQIDALNEKIGQREARIEQIRAAKLAVPPVAPPASQTGVPCPSCKQLIPEGAAFCPVCGYKIPKTPPPAESSCPSCRSPMPSAAQFCPNCGARKAQAPQTIRCTGCGAELPKIAVFCPDCGTRVGAVAPPAPSATSTQVPAVVASAAVAPAIPEEPGIPEALEAAPAPQVPLRSDEPDDGEAPVTPAAALPSAEPVEVVPSVTPEAALPPDELARVVAAIAPKAAPNSLMKPCSSCQAELPTEATFCPNCGARQQAP